MRNKRVEYRAGDTNLKGYVAYDDSHKDKRPAVIVCHDWSGCNEFARAKADKLAELGYVGFAVDMYGDGKTASDKNNKIALMQPLLDDRNLLKQRITAAYETVQAMEQVDNSRIALIGFCFGGLCGLDLARSGANIQGIISFHGVLQPPTSTSTTKITAKILVLHGYADPMVPPEQVISFANEMNDAKADWQIHMYGHAKHAFTNPQADEPDLGLAYNKLADKRSWVSMENFLAEIF